MDPKKHAAVLHQSNPVAQRPPMGGGPATSYGSPEELAQAEDPTLAPDIAARPEMRGVVAPFIRPDTVTRCEIAAEIMVGEREAAERAR